MLKNIFYLRKLHLRKNRNLFKKDLIINFLFFRKIKNNYFYKLNHYTSLIFSKSIFNFIKVLPIFFFSKKIFFNHTNFNSWLKNNNLNYLFIKNYNNNNFKKNNSEIFIFEKSGVYDNKYKGKYDLYNFINLSANTNDNLLAIPKNIQNKELGDINKISLINYQINFNIYMLNSIEFYKILIILYLNKCNL